MTRRKIEPETTTVQVTRLMVDYALQQTSTMCGVALALREANPDWELPRVTQKDIRVTDRRTGKRLIWKTPRRVATWIDKFDRRREAVGPMAFVLGEPDQTRPIKHRQPSQIIADSQRFQAYRSARKTAGSRVGANRAPLPAGFTASRTRTLREPSEDL